MFNWFKKKETYPKEAVVYIIREILRQTIDKELIHNILTEDLKRDSIEDEKKLVEWINRLDQLKERHK